MTDRPNKLQKSIKDFSPTRKLKALIFDVGDILYDASEWRRWLTNQLVEMGVDVTYPQLVNVWECLLVDVYKGDAGYWSRFAQLMNHFGLDANQTRDLEEQARKKGAAVQLDRKPMPQVPETLGRLKDLGISLVALSDNESGESGVRKTLNQLGIEDCFLAVVSSCTIGHVKPEPEAFDYAINASEHHKSECGFVAHDVDELQGAQDHDLFAIGYNCHPGAPADLYIQDFSELLQLV